MFGILGGRLAKFGLFLLRRDELLVFLLGLFVGISYCGGFFRADGQFMSGKSSFLIRSIVAEAWSVFFEDMRDFFLRRFGSRGRYAFALELPPLDMIAVSYNFVAKETTGKLFLEDKHFSLSMNNEFDLILRSCSKRALFIRRSW